MKSGTRFSNDLNHLPIFHDRLVLKDREGTRLFQQVSNLPEVFGCQITEPLLVPASAYVAPCHLTISEIRVVSGFQTNLAC